MPNLTCACGSEYSSDSAICEDQKKHQLDIAATSLIDAVAADPRDGATRRYFDEHGIRKGRQAEIMQRSIDLMMQRSRR